MKKLLLLFLALTLCLSSCKKDSVDSQPVVQMQLLQGKWAGVSTRAIQKNSAGQIVSDKTFMLSPGSYGIDISATEVIIYYNGALNSRHDYTVSGNTIQETGSSREASTVDQLNATRLVITQPETAPAAGNTLFRTITYSR